MGKRLMITIYNNHIAFFGIATYLSRIWVVEMRETEAGNSVKLHNKNKSFKKAVGKQKVVPAREEAGGGIVCKKPLDHHLEKRQFKVMVEVILKSIQFIFNWISFNYTVKNWDTFQLLLAI